MRKRIVVDGANLPVRWPVGLTWLVVLSQATWDIPGWLVGVIWTLVVIIWIVAAVDIFHRENRKVFPEDQR